MTTKLDYFSCCFSTCIDFHRKGEKGCHFDHHATHHLEHKRKKFDRTMGSNLDSLVSLDGDGCDHHEDHHHHRHRNNNNHQQHLHQFNITRKCEYFHILQLLI